VIFGAQVRKARETAGLSLAEAANLIGTSRAELAAWERDEEQPEVGQLESLADAFGRDIDYFLRSTPDEPPAFTFRSPLAVRHERFSREARLAVSRFEELCRKANELEELLGVSRRRDVPAALPNESPEVAAGRQRTSMGLGEGPVKGIREKLSALGIRVFEVTAPSDELSGLSSPNSVYGPRILVNAADRFGRRHFTLAHEFAHLFYRDSASVCHLGDSPATERGVERRADVFALELLLPQTFVGRDAEQRLDQPLSLHSLARFAARWRVSIQAMGYRLEGLEVIPRGTTNELLQTGAPPSFPVKRRQPKWIRQLGPDYIDKALIAYRAGHFSVGRLAIFLGIPYRKAFEIVHKDSPL